MWKCVACGKDNQDNRDFCWNCATDKDGTPPKGPQAFESAEKGKAAQPSSPPQPPQPQSTQTRIWSASLPSPAPETSASGFASALRVFGVIDLIIGVIGGLIIYSNSPSYGPYYLVVALAVMFQGVFMFVLCNVIAEIAEDVRALRNKLSNQG